MNDRIDIAPDFKLSEFACNCGCGDKRINLTFIKRLQAARTIDGRPFVVTSGVRCEQENQRVGGSDDSAHVPDYMEGTAHATDLKAESSRRRYQIVRALLSAGFTRIGIMKDGIHVDDADRIGQKDANVIWDYY